MKNEKQNSLISTMAGVNPFIPTVAGLACCFFAARGKANKALQVGMIGSAALALGANAVLTDQEKRAMRR